MQVEPACSLLRRTGLKTTFMTYVHLLLVQGCLAAPNADLSALPPPHFFSKINPGFGYWHVFVRP